MVPRKGYYRSRYVYHAAPKICLQFKHSVIGDVRVKVFQRDGKAWLICERQKAFKAFAGATIAVNGYTVCVVDKVTSKGRVVALVSCDIAYPPKPFECVPTLR